MKRNIYDILKRPLVTEKSNYLQKYSQYCFVVSIETKKKQIKKAITEIFSVNVASVNIINMKGKSKVFKGHKGSRPAFKKAIITTQDMKKIEFSKKA